MNLQELLKDSDPQKVESFLAYIEKLRTDKKKDGQNWVQKNPWMNHRDDTYLSRVFNAVISDGLSFDGVDVTLNVNGVSYSYQAYKNKMLIAYPESIIDVALVHKEDVFRFTKKSGNVEYVHDIADPFNQSEKTVIGAYCVIKNKRGQFLTLLSKTDIDKHRNAAKTDKIWKLWFLEMALKTIMKKACKQHYKDIYSDIEILDNDNYDLANLDEKEPLVSKEQVKELEKLIKDSGADAEKFLSFIGFVSLDKMELSSFDKAKSALKAKATKNDN